MYRLYRLIKLIFIFISGIKKVNGFTPQESYFAMRELFVLTNGYFNDIVSVYFSLRYPKYKETSRQGILGDLSPSSLNNIVAQIKKDGYYVSNQKLNNQIVERLVNYAKNTPAAFLDLGSEDGQKYLPDNKLLFNSDSPISPIYRFDMEQLFENHDIQGLIVDQSLMAIAQEYLNCSPVLDLVAMWWSAPFNDKGTSEAAQEYHFDMDRIKFLKVFIYLTDVDPNTGPHCYVRNSHIRKPKSLLSDGRKTDAEIHSYYPISDCKELCGKAGTIILADTRGFHKGKSLLEKNRLIFELEFANSLFGHNYPKVNYLPSHELVLSKFIKQYPRTYSQIFKIP